MPQRLEAVLWKQLLQRHARESMTLQGQIREMLVSAILDGQLPPEVPLPSSREMANELGVARNTVMLAYQQLAEEGYLVSRERSGYFVNVGIVAGRVRGAAQRDREEARGAPNWAKRFRMRVSEQRNIIKPADWQRFPYPFLYGQFDAALFPAPDWRECCFKALGVLDIRQWAPDQITRDDEMLTQQIRTRVLPRRGVWASADELIVTVGAQHALFSVADLLVREGTRVAVEDPGYPDARNSFAIRTRGVVPLAVDGEGLPVDERLASMDYVCVTPSHQCPTGVTMPLARREALLRAASEFDFVVIEDDYESENPLDREPVPALKSLDKHDRVIYVGSLSKSLAPGLRIGYVVGPSELIAELRALRRLMLRHPSAFIQRAFALFLSLGHHDALLRRLASIESERCAVVLEALAHHAPQCHVMPAEGGGWCWLRLPDPLDANDLASRVRERGVLIEPGDVFFCEDPRPRSFFRLGYSSIATKSIEPGIRILGETIASMQPRR